MLTWSREIRSFDDLPKHYHQAYRNIIDCQEEIPYTVLTPPLPGTRYRVTEKIIFSSADRLYILENLDRQITTTAYDLNAITHLEIGNILLYSWLSIHGRTTRNRHKSTAIPYNTSTQRYTAPFITTIRSMFHSQKGQPPKNSQNFDYLGPVNFKFMNYARKSLYAEEPVLESIWQPEITQVVFSLFGWSWERSINLPHLVILTNQEVILIAEDVRSPLKKGKRYGGVWHYIPLQNIDSGTIRATSNDLRAVTFSISQQAELKLLFEKTKHGQLLAFKKKLEKQIALNKEISQQIP